MAALLLSFAGASLGGALLGPLGVVGGRIVGANRAGHLLVLGGNQGDAVSISPFPRGRELGYRWPGNELLPEAAPLPVLAHG
ncbi:MAG TPA: hypothetical protein VIG34_04575 [Xanthobacteraceae bacterium]|jgi:hypothetical protein